MDGIGAGRTNAERGGHRIWRIALTIIVFIATLFFASLASFALLELTGLPYEVTRVVGLIVNLLGAAGVGFAFWKGTRKRAPGSDVLESRHIARRLGASAFVFATTFLVVATVPFALAYFVLSIETNRVVQWTVSLIAAGTASVAWWRWSGTNAARSRRGGPISRIATGAIAVGSVGFLLGFVGPMVLSPESNQGPLLGIFITGPGGFLLGAIGGYVYWLVTRNRATA